jgi:hypothetical protein
MTFLDWIACVHAKFSVCPFGHCNNRPICIKSRNCRPCSTNQVLAYRILHVMIRIKKWDLVVQRQHPIQHPNRCVHNTSLGYRLRVTEQREIPHPDALARSGPRSDATSNGKRQASSFTAFALAAAAISRSASASVRASTNRLTRPPNSYASYRSSGWKYW